MIFIKSKNHHHYFTSLGSIGIITMIVCSILLSLTACNKLPYKKQVGQFVGSVTKGGDDAVIDKEIKSSRKEFEDNLHAYTDSGGVSPSSLDLEPISPELAPQLVTPNKPEVGQNKLISLSVTEDVPLKDVLIEIARLANINIEVDPTIQGGIILRVNDKPLNEVIDRVAKLANLRYRYEDGILRVERDLPYIKNYPVDFLNLSRSSNSDTSISTRVISSLEGGGGDNSTLNSGSQSKLSAEYDGNLWISIARDLSKLLNISVSDEDLKSGNIATPSPQAASGGQTGSSPSQQSASSSTSQTLLSDEQFDERGRFISINKQAGIITIRATDLQHNEINQYLSKIKASVSAQVLIEAKVIEVTLDKEYRQGINWNLVDMGRFTATGGFNAPIASVTDLVTFGVLNSNKTDLDFAIKLTELFGTSRALSSPRLHAMNNQQAILSFAVNEVYFKLNVEEQEDQVNTGTTKTLNIDSDIFTVPIGIILTLQPSINLDTNEITMNIRPTLSRIRKTVEDPGVKLIAARNNANVSSTIPVVEVRELDSILKIRSGQVMVIGGLLEERNINTDNGIPYLATLPVVGNLFKSVEKDKQVIETVIFIKATIVPGFGVGPEDQHLYKTYIKDPRPLVF